MPSQRGFFDTLKNAEGKVFTYSKTIEITSPDDTSVITFPAGTKTIPATTDIINGDGTANRKLKAINLRIEDGTNANTVLCYTESMFNGDVIGSTDNVAKGATTGNFTLGANGANLIIKAAGLTGNVVSVMSCSFLFNSTALTIGTLFCIADANDIYLYFYNGAGAVDITALGAGTQMQILITYITSG